jgi:hypothetical protein
MTDDGMTRVPAPASTTAHVYMLDWRGSRPLNVRMASGYANAGRYEYSFSIDVPLGRGPVAACEYAYFRQGNNLDGKKVRTDRQTMSTGDVVVLDGEAWLCAGFGFQRAPGLAELLGDRMERSWRAWADQRGVDFIEWGTRYTREEVTQLLDDNSRAHPEDEDAWLKLMHDLQEALDDSRAGAFIAEAMEPVVQRLPEGCADSVEAAD